ncbi:hypothetical protein AWC38_SpisGene23040 [Stylophora pistillata]|uniref:Uncharacterized protein n=1 Tax=Stylophora pistillata TaxID=50429 RepID=A0A2B4R7Y1_STYPI|nr:hypothetical protein AWC38_SpisGene23040 [Stylophora pistillata]
MASTEFFFDALFSYVSLPPEVLPTVPATVIVPTVSLVVQRIKSAEKDVTSVHTTTSAERASNAVIANASVFGLLASVHTTSNVDRASSAVPANASIVRFLVPVRTTTNAMAVSNAVTKIASVACLLVPVRTTTNATVASNAGTENASVVCFLVPVRTTTNVALEWIVVGECVRLTVVGALGLFQPTAATTVRFSSDTHDDDAASTSSSADELQSDSSRFQSGSSALLKQSITTKPESFTARTSLSGADAGCCKR